LRLGEAAEEEQPLAAADKESAWLGTFVQAGLRDVAPPADPAANPGVVLSAKLKDFTKSLLLEVSRHRHWQRFLLSRD
jgi:hypothetical protein